MFCALMLCFVQPHARGYVVLSCHVSPDLARPQACVAVNLQHEASGADTTLLTAPQACIVFLSL